MEFEPWSFSETQLSDLPGGTVSFTAEAFPGNTLREILCTENDSDENKIRAREVAAAVCSAIEGARAQKINLNTTAVKEFLSRLTAQKLFFSLRFSLRPRLQVLATKCSVTCRDFM